MDCKVLFNVWRKSGINVFYFSVVLSGCRILTSRLEFFNLYFVKRAANRAIDFLSKFAFNFSDVIWVEDLFPRFGFSPHMG